MITLKIINIYFIILAFCAMGCQTSTPNSNFNPNHYLGHLKLDSSELIVTEVATGLEIPWEITYGPDNWIWFTEQKGLVSHIYPFTGEKKILLKISDVFYKKSMGLTSMVLHPDFDKTPYVYLHYTFSVGDKQENIKSRIVRYTYRKDTLVSPFILLDSIPGKTYHNGSRMVITPDKKLFFSMGDAGDKNLSQNPYYLNGKILRLNLDGSVPDDNPILGNPVWSWGHRNPQGLVYTSTKRLYSSEHGVNNDDEINLILKGNNYGWPNVEGFCDLPVEKLYCKDSSVREPLITWSPTVAVAGLDYYDRSDIPEWNNSLLLCNLKGQALRILNLNTQGDKITGEHFFFQKLFGRIRDVCIGNNGDIYISTSNLDWHPQLQPWMYDSLPAGGDKIIRLQVATKEMRQRLEEMSNTTLLMEDTIPLDMPTEIWDFEASGPSLSNGQVLYMQSCSPCHLPNGKGIKDLCPPIKNSEWVSGDKSHLIQVLLKGLSDRIEVNGIAYEQEMPSYTHLSDEKLADILTYIRNSFGNKASAVIPGEILEERKGLSPFRDN